MSNTSGGNTPISQAQLQAMIRKQIQNANNRDLSFSEDVLNRAGGGGPFWQGRPEITLNQLGTDWRNIRSLEANRRYWDRGPKFGSGMKEQHRARGREVADGYADEEEQDGPYSWEGNGEEDVSEPGPLQDNGPVQQPWEVPESRSTYVGGQSTFDPAEMVGGSAPATPAAKPKRVMTPEQRERSNTRRRELSAERREAVTRVKAQDEMNWSGSGVMIPNADPGPLWSGGPDA